MSGDKKSDLELLDLAMEFADAHSHFDSSFIVSLKDACHHWGSLSHKQRASLENVVRKWRMEEWGEKNL